MRELPAKNLKGRSAKIVDELYVSTDSNPLEIGNPAFDADFLLVRSHHDGRVCSSSLRHVCQFRTGVSFIRHAL